MSKIVLVLCVAVLASTLQRAATRRDFAQSHWRSLLESPNSGMAPANASNTTQGDKPYGENTVVQTVEVDLMQQECIIVFNTYLSPFGNGNREIVAPRGNTKTTSSECCTACHSHPDCNAWQWCPMEMGCNLPANSTIAVQLNDTFPYMGCQLMNILGFSSYVIDMSPVRARSPDVPFVAGALVNMSAPQLAGYQVTLGADLDGLYDYPCAGSDSVEDRCQVNGSAQDIADACTADPACQGFVFFPNGIEAGESSPVGLLKSPGPGGKILPSDADLNPMAALYLKDGSAASSPQNSTTPAFSDDKKDNTVEIAVVSSVVGTTLIAAVIAGTLYIRKFRKMSRSFPQGAIVAEQRMVGGADEDIVPKADDQVVDTIGHMGSEEIEVASLSQDKSSTDSGGVSPPSGLESGSGTTVSGSSPHLPPPDLAAFMALPHHMQNVVVSELTAREVPPSLAGDRPAAGHSGSGAAGSSARDLLEAFSQMYKQQPVVDYSCLLEKTGSAALDEDQGKDASAAQQNGEAETGAGGTGMARQASAPLDIMVNDWAIAPEEVEVCRRPDGSWWQLGTGAFGTVYKGLYHGVHSVAIKILHQLEGKCHTDAFVREVMLLKALRHRNVVQFLGAYINGPAGTAMLVTELMELGDLWRALPAVDPSGVRLFSWHRRGRQTMHDIAQGLHYLHSRRVVHFDLKSANILLSRSGTAKLADIGMARVLNKSYLSVVSSGLGTFAWSAPEVLAGRRCTEKADIYSFGVVLWEVCTGEAPVRGDMRPLRAPEDCPAEVVELYERCVAEDPELRPTAREVLDALGMNSAER